MYLSRFPLLITVLCLPFPLLYASEDKAREFAADCRERLTDARVIRGDAGEWFFPTREIRQLSLGNFWEKPWKIISRNQSDPVPSMLEFHNLLASKNVKLLIVPVPAKATIYPEKFSRNFKPGDAQGLSPFLAKLKEEGLNVVDLEPLFVNERKRQAEEKFWCARDAHFSPMSCVRLGDLIASILEKDFGVKRRDNPGLQRSKPEKIRIRGDLVANSKWEKSFPRESLKVQYVTSSSGCLQSDIKSPVLLLGDSHTLVFSDGENFHCEGAGLFDHLSFAMGSEVDLEGNADGGLVTSRINLFRKAVANPGYWDRKKVVVWVFTAREFTQNSYSRGFISIPIER